MDPGKSKRIDICGIFSINIFGIHAPAPVELWFNTLLTKQCFVSITILAWAWVVWYLYLYLYQFCICICINLYLLSCSWVVLGNAQVCSRLAAATSVPAAAALLLLLLQWLRESSTVKSAGSLLLLVSLVGHSALSTGVPLVSSLQQQWFQCADCCRPPAVSQQCHFLLGRGEPGGTLKIYKCLRVLSVVQVLAQC